jgi:hypothetical protein
VGFHIVFKFFDNLIYRIERIWNLSIAMTFNENMVKDQPILIQIIVSVDCVGCRKNIVLKYATYVRSNKSITACKLFYMLLVLKPKTIKLF